MTGGGPNEAEEVEDEDILILSSEEEVSTSVKEKVSEMLSSTPAFTGICGSFDLFEPPTTLPHKQKSVKPVCTVRQVHSLHFKLGLDFGCGFTKFVMCLQHENSVKDLIFLWVSSVPESNYNFSMIMNTSEIPKLSMSIVYHLMLF